MASTLLEWKNKIVCVVTCDGRIIVGELAGHDQVQNLILQNSHERVYSIDVEVEQVPLGLYVIRGDNVALISDVEDKEWDDTVKAEPLNSVTQQTM
mmetsp:Transcript_19489/g.23395  ORF Transcript_19489/g.23395 Transcript_19489/m.23395 type:complete len:96 (-) Transcript_19489:88-375(-)